MSELDELFPTWFKKIQVIFSGRIPASMDGRQQEFVIPYAMFEKAIEAYISKHYIKRDDVLEAVGEIKKLPTWEHTTMIEAYDVIGIIKSKLNLGDK